MRIDCCVGISYRIYPDVKEGMLGVPIEIFVQPYAGCRVQIDRSWRAAAGVSATFLFSRNTTTSRGLRSEILCKKVENLDELIGEPIRSAGKNVIDGLR